MPVINWVTKQRPSKDPKFHRLEILAGVGRSTKEPLIIFKTGCVFKWDAI